MTPQKIYGVWHLCLDGPEWQPIMQSQLKRIIESGLWDATERIFVNAVRGSQVGWMVQMPLEFFHRKVTLYHSLNMHDFEFLTLKMVQDFAKLGSEQCPAEYQPFNMVQHPFKLWYIHSKGLFPRGYSKLWREYMEYFVIDRWEDCVRVLGEYDICGVEWRTKPYPHFSGNFWWATDSYLQKLPDVLEYWSASKHDRIGAEMWIGRENPKFKDFSNFGCDMYHVAITKNMYEVKGQQC